MLTWLIRRLHGRDACPVRTCRGKREGYGFSVWCKDHTRAILADTTPEYRLECAKKLGARRWLLRAEVTLEEERKSVPVLEGILEMSPADRSYPSNRACWDRGPVKLSGRVDELLQLGLGSR